jgi:hypothetical protein
MPRGITRGGEQVFSIVACFSRVGLHVAPNQFSKVNVHMKKTFAAILPLWGAFSMMAGLGLNDSGVVRVLHIQGDVTCSVNGKNWQCVRPETELPTGSTLRTVVDATADLLLQYNGSVYPFGLGQRA